MRYLVRPEAGMSDTTTRTRGGPVRPFAALGRAALCALGLTVLACNENPVTPDTASSTALGRDDGTVTVPIKIQFREGSFVVVPFGDPRIPPGTPKENCPVGEANPELGLPAGFPNGGGVVVSHGTGEATLLGRFEFVQTQCAVQFFPVTDPPFVNFDVRSTLIAADGSRIFVRGPFARIGLTPPSVPRPIFNVIGGTGRFAGATGSVPQSVGLEATCTDDSGLCLTGFFTGGVTEGEITIPLP